MNSLNGEHVAPGTFLSFSPILKVNLLRPMKQFFWFRTFKRVEPSQAISIDHTFSRTITTLAIDFHLLAQSTVSMATFTKFPELNAALRFKIWEDACFLNPRVFEVSNVLNNRLEIEAFWADPSEPVSYNHLLTGDKSFEISSKNESDWSTPIILYVSREARAEAMRHLK